MEQASTKNIGYNVEQMTINMSGGTLVQHADLVQASGDVRVDHPASLSAASRDSAESILGIPRPNKYSDVRRYILERIRFDDEFSKFYNDATRVDLCKRLTNEFGWDVDPENLGRNINRYNARQRKK